MLEILFKSKHTLFDFNSINFSSEHDLLMNSPPAQNEKHPAARALETEVGDVTNVKVSINHICILNTSGYWLSSQQTVFSKDCFYFLHW